MDVNGQVVTVLESLAELANTYERDNDIHIFIEPRLMGLSVCVVHKTSEARVHKVLSWTELRASKLDVFPMVSLTMESLCHEIS